MRKRICYAGSVFRALRNREPLTTILWADAGLEFLVALVCFALAGPASNWLGIPEAALYVAGVVFVVAGIAIIPLARKPSVVGVTALGWANIIGGAALWVVLALAWGSVAAEGRWVLAAVADSFIVVGVAELFALRKIRQSAFE
jgi:hypothetical protein